MTKEQEAICIEFIKWMFARMTRCENCFWYYAELGRCENTQGIGGAVSCEDFCSKGKRREISQQGKRV